MTGPRIELLFQLAPGHGEYLGQRHQAALQPGQWLLGEQGFGDHAAHPTGEQGRSHRQRTPPRRYLDSGGVQEVQALAGGVTVPPPLFEKLGRVPKRFAEPQYDFENVSDLETCERPLFRGYRGRESERARLEHRDGERHDRGARLRDLERSTVARMTFNADIASLPRDDVRDRAQAELRSVGIEAIAQPLHQRVVAIRDPELLVCANFLFASPPAPALAPVGGLVRKRLRAQPLRMRGVPPFDEALEHGTSERRESRRVEVFADGEIFAALRDPADQVAIHTVDDSPKIGQRLEPSSGHELVQVGKLEDAESRRPRDRERLARFAVHELGAELEGHRHSGIMTCENPTADARPRFDDGDAEARL